MSNAEELDDFRNFYASYLDKQYPNDDPTEDSSYTQLRDFWPAADGILIPHIGLPGTTG